MTLSDFICAQEKCGFKTSNYWRMIDHAEQVHKLRVIEAPIRQIYRREGEMN
ncbi:MAG: hypothetical protein ACE5J2_01870 [Nitrososphaerales archaeon]